MTSGPSRRPAGPGRLGTEPATARSALALRRGLSLTATAVFCVGTVLFAVWAGLSDDSDTPSATLLWALTGVCALLALLAGSNALVVHRRRSRERDPAAGP
jgi:hypothetical protein